MTAPYTPLPSWLKALTIRDLDQVIALAPEASDWEDFSNSERDQIGLTLSGLADPQAGWIRSDYALLCGVLPMPLQMSLLHDGVRQDHEALVRYLLEDDARTAEQRNERDSYALVLAARRGHAGVLRALLERLDPTVNHSMALLAACETGQVVSVRLLAEVSTVSDADERAMISALQQPNAVELLAFLAPYAHLDRVVERLRQETHSPLSTLFDPPRFWARVDLLAPYATSEQRQSWLAQGDAHLPECAAYERARARQNYLHQQASRSTRARPRS